MKPDYFYYLLLAITAFTLGMCIKLSVQMSVRVNPQGPFEKEPIVTRQSDGWYIDAF